MKKLLAIAALAVGLGTTAQAYYNSGVSVSNNGECNWVYTTYAQDHYWFDKLRINEYNDLSDSVNYHTPRANGTNFSQQALCFLNMALQYGEEDVQTKIETHTGYNVHAALSSLGEYETYDFYIQADFSVLPASMASKLGETSYGPMEFYNLWTSADSSTRTAMVGLWNDADNGYTKDGTFLEELIFDYLDY